MRKLSLKVDGLEVDSFATDNGQGARGTVRGKDTIITEWCTGYPDCVSKRCQTPHDTCYGSCECTNGCPQFTQPPACQEG